MNRKATCLPILLLLFTIAFSTGGCDLTRVDEGADLSSAEHLVALSSASSPDAAKKALRGVLNKAQIGVRGEVKLEQGPYDGYLFESKDLEALAEVQAKFVAGDRSQGMTFREVYNEVRASKEQAAEIMVKTPVTPVVEQRIGASVEDVLAVFESEARTALANPNSPEGALFLVASAQGASLPNE